MKSPRNRQKIIHNVTFTNNLITWTILNLSWLFCITFLFMGLRSTSVLAAYVAECPAEELILPCKCLTRGNEYQIWCSHSELPSVLEGLKSIGKLIQTPIDELILENNNLPALPGRFFLPVRAMRLMLRNNYLQRVSSGWLTGQEDTLMELYMVEPELRSLPIDSLDHLHQLEAVTIKSTLMKRTPRFSNLPKLRYIQIESFSLIELSPRGFHMLPSLEKLHITGSDHLSRLEANILQDLPRLKVVNISFNAINWMHPRALTQLPSMVELHLVGNQIADAGMIGRGTRDLPALTVLRLDYNNIEQLGEASFVDIPSLQDLYLSYNQITEIHHGAFHRVPKLKMLNLNHNLVRHVHPESFLQHSSSGLEELWLVDNDISHVSELRSLLDALPRLIFLDMSYNYLEDIKFGSLRGHATLERLHLDHNKIQMVERESFTAMPALRELRLKNNSLSNLLDGPLWNLPALKGLELSQNYFKRLEPRLLANLPSLRRLDISENQLTIVGPATFLETPALEHVNLSHNILSSLHPATFRHLVSLYEVDIGYNRLVEFVPGLPRNVEYLHIPRNQIKHLPLPPSPDLDLPSLRVLDISRNGLTKITPNSLRTLPQLRRLNLGRNAIQSLENNCLDGLSRLEILDLHDNRLMLLHPRCLANKLELRELNLRNNNLEMIVPEILQDAQHLRRLDISNNRLTEIMSGTFQTTRELQHFDASYNSLSQLPPSIRNLKNLKTLDLTNNRLRFLQPETLSSLASLTELRISRNRIQELRQRAFDNLPNLQMLELQENELENIEPYSINQLPKLTELKLGKNRLRMLPDNAFSDLPGLQIAELQENNLQNIGDQAFYKVPHLLLLNLSSNQLPNLDQAGLRSVRSLEVLDLSNNKLSKIDNSNMDKMEWLVELKMDNNRICTVQGAPFNGMPRLRVLSLRNNRMTYLPEHSVKRLRSNIAVLDIDGNPIACTCSMIWMRAWLEEASELGPRCSDGQYLREVRLSRQECQNNIQNKQITYSPGCETESLSSNLYSTSQVFSQYQNIKETPKPNNSPLASQSMAPTPEESDYFYDEYVDYPYNETNILALEQNNSIYNEKVRSTTPKPEKISSHFVPGDTPTIYAETKLNSTSHVPNLKVPSPGTSGFTFFGVPLPTLSIGSLWGSGRKADRKMIGRGNGRLQSYPEGYGSNQIHRPYPNHPEIQKGGFMPMLPGSGGFTPMIGNKTEGNLFENKHDFINIDSSNQSDSKITKRGPHFVATIEKTNNPIQYGEEVKLTPNGNKVTITRLDSKPNISTTERSTTERVTTELAIKEVLSTPSSTTPALKTSTILYDNFLSSTSSFTSIDNDSKDTKIITNETMYNFPIEDIVQKPIDSWNSKSGGESPSALSALLIPGGLQPQQYKPPAGRPVITKVEMKNNTESGEKSVLEDFFAEITKDDGNNLEILNLTSESSTAAASPDSSMSWYFKIYNQTNLEPYIGPGYDTHSLVSSVHNSIGNRAGKYLISYLIVLLTTSVILL